MTIVINAFINYFCIMIFTADIKQLLLYIAKCITGISIVFLLSWLFNYHDIGWCIISVILVISPDSKEALPLAITRIKANLLAGVASLLFLLFGPSNILTICLSLAVTIILCHIFKVMAGSRSALAAVIIIMMHNNDNPAPVHFWFTALERILSVISGCLIALTVTFLYHQKLHYPVKGVNTQDNEG
jgi:uncharacterized membrane protein YgaE (UPF0421/DUF939 family)